MSGAPERDRRNYSREQRIRTAVIRTAVIRTAVVRTAVLRTAVLRTAVIWTAVIWTAVIRTAVIRKAVVFPLPDPRRSTADAEVKDPRWCPCKAIRGSLFLAQKPSMLRLLACRASIRLPCFFCLPFPIHSTSFPPSFFPSLDSDTCHKERFRTLACQQQCISLRPHMTLRG